MISFASLNAQTIEKRNSIGVLFQLKYNLQKDEVFSRVPRKSLMYGLALNYTYNTNFKVYRIELGANTGTIKSFTSTTKGIEITGFLAFTNLYKIKSESGKFGYWYGAKLKFDFDAIPSDNGDALRYGWDALASINPTIKIDYAISPKLTANYETDFNAIGILWRPNAQGYTLHTEELLETKGILAAMFENPRFSSLHNIFKWNNRFTFNYYLKKETSLQAIYDINYVNISVPRKKRSFSSAFRIGLQHKF